MRILPLVVCVAAMTAGCKKAANEPGATPAAAVVRVTEIDLGRSLAADKGIADKTSDFRPTDTIYALGRDRRNRPAGDAAARWTYQDGQVVKESYENIAPTGKARTEFHIVQARRLAGRQVHGGGDAQWRRGGQQGFRGQIGAARRCRSGRCRFRPGGVRLQPDSTLGR